MKIPALPLKEKERLNALRSYKILDTGADPEFDRIVELAAIVCRTPVALITLVDEKRQWFKAKIGVELTEVPRKNSFCQYTVLDTEIFEVEDATKDERFKENLFVNNEPNIKFYAGCPIIDPNGYAIGSLCVLSPEVKVLSAEQKRALTLLAEDAMELIITKRQKEEFVYFDKLYQLSTDLICIAGLDGFFKKVNPAFQTLLGWSTEYLLNNSFLDLVHPDDLALNIAELKKLSEQKNTSHFTCRYLTSRGDYKILQWTATFEPETQYIFAIARDITQDSIREEEIKVSENNLRSFFENSQGLMCTHDLGGRFISVNATASDVLGYSQEELSRMSLFDLVPEDNHDLVVDYLQQILRHGISSGLLSVMHKDGVRKILLYNNVMEQDLEGHSYIIGNSIDITEKHRLEQTLKKTKRLLEQTNYVAQIGGWDYDPKTKKLTWSDVTRHIHEVDDDFEPDLETAISFYKDEESREKVRNLMHDSVVDGRSWDLELMIVTAMGREIWVKVLGHAEFKDGKCKKVFGTFQDIHERKSASIALYEEKSRLSAFVTHAPAAVAMFDKELCYIAASNRWIEEYHLEGREILGKSHYDVFPDIGQNWKSIHLRSLNGEVIKKDLDVWQPNGWDHEQFLRWEVRPWYQFDGSVGGIMMFTQDITETTQRRGELKKAKEQAEQASMAKSAFLANMSHEIRTPLNGVIGFTDLVLKTTLNDEQKQYLQIVNESANALLGIINDILDFSKIESGKLELDIEECNLYELGNQAINIISFQAQSKDLKVLLSIPSDLPPMIWADSLRLRQVLINLLGNAVKFTDKGGIELKIKPLGVKDSGDFIFRFEVRDTGIGIKMDKQGQIFEAFAQEAGYTTKKYGGTGLGLTISNQLLGLMGSKLQLKSVPGTGSTFFFDLKLRVGYGNRAPVQEDPKAVKKKRILASREQPESSEKPIHVLIAEDNLINMLLAKTIVRRIAPNCSIHEAVNGLECLAYCTSNPTDIILMDIQMPEMNGYEATEQIRSIDALKHIPIIALTAGNVKGEKEKCLATGMNDFLAKPVMEEEIVLVFKKWLK